MNIFTPLKVRENNFIKRFNEKYPLFEYVSGYTHSDNPILIKCKLCDYEFYRSAQIIRAGYKKILTCPNCIKKERERQKTIIKIEKAFEKQMKLEKKKKNKEHKDLIKYLKQHTIYIKHCKYCGKEMYVDNIRKEVCTICYHKIRKKHSSKSLQKLYKRDNGICYLCGGKCNLEDYIVVNGNIICGDYYPSIEHVIPISKGGTDNWDNIKLAHRICNNLKGNQEGF